MDLRKELSTRQSRIPMNGSSSVNQSGIFQGMQFQIARAAIRVEAARLLTYNAARIKRKARISQRKLRWPNSMPVQAAHKVARSAIEWAGA